MKQRLEYIDIAKAIALYMVVLGHAMETDSHIFRFIFTFHMPFFFLISGYCFSEKNRDAAFLDYSMKKARELILPYMLFSFIGLGIMMVFGSWIPQMDVETFVLRYIYYAQPMALGQSWFLICLLVSLIYFKLVLIPAKKVGNETAVIVPAMLLFAVMAPLAERYQIIPRFERLPWKLDSAFAAVVFVMGGYLFKKTGLMKKVTAGMAAVAAVILMILTWLMGVRLNGYVNICDLRFSDPVLYFLGAFTGSIGLMMGAKVLEMIFSGISKGQSRIIRSLTWIGRNTLPIFGIHSFILWAFIRAYGKVTGVNVEVFWGGIKVFALAFAAYLCSMLFVPVYDFLVGKKV